MRECPERKVVRSAVRVWREVVSECGGRYGREVADERTEVIGRMSEESNSSKEELTGRL